MTIGTDPVAFTIGSIEVRWYGIFIALCIATMILWLWYFGKKAKIITPELAIGAGLTAVPAGIIFSKLLHVIDKFGYYMDNPGDIFNRGGLTVFGAIIGGILGAWLYCRFRKEPFGPLGDVAVPGIALGQVVGRMACTLNGCCAGKLTTLPWAFTYTNDQSEAWLLNEPLHPTQAYEMLLNLVLFAVTFWILRGRLRPPGMLMAAYLAMYAAGTAIIRVFRGDTETFIGSLQEAQFVSILIVIVCVGLLIAKKTYWVRKGDLAPAIEEETENI
ncbi:prolipoprotein diacylglyceryl transferase [Chloroflexota bacterium]